MANEVVRVFERFADAEHARSALLAAGFEPASVHLSALEDEAGPVEGNFVAGNGRTARGRTGVLRSPTDDQDQPYELNYAEVVYRGVHVLAIDADDEERRRLGADILDGLGGRSV